MKAVAALILERLTVAATVMFLWVSGVVGLFAGTADIVQYFRYTRGFPALDFSMNLLAGAACFLMFFFSAAAVSCIRKIGRLWFARLIAASTAMACVPAFLQRPPIGSALRPDLFIYLAGLGASTLVLYLLTAPSTNPAN